MNAHLLFAWAWITAGLAAGVLLGAFFARDDWLGGYGSWPRRLLRLGHISLVGTGLLNLGAAWTLAQLAVAGPLAAGVRTAFVTGAVAMPAVCVLAAFAPRWRHLFALPVTALLSGAVMLVVAPLLAGEV